MSTAGLVFVGPCLLPRPTDTPHVQYWPPARRGDLERAATTGVRVIGLIDGVFGQTLAVTPAEVRNAARGGLQLFGGASMGALRACECPQAMQGVGEIWDRFVRRELTDDDEVAVTFLPGSYQTVAYPLVQVREMAQLALQQYPDASAELEQFVASVRQLPFVERTLEQLRQLAATLTASGIAWAKLEEWLTAPAFDLKRRDALRVVAAVAAAVSQSC